jgi:segregation and condensation protein B
MNDDKFTIRRTIEALLFASADPLSVQKITVIIDQPAKVVNECLKELQEEYQLHQHAFVLEEIAQGYILRTDKSYAKYIDRLHGNRRADKLSHASMEVLAIVAYRQPITRPQIDAIRGVDSSGPIVQLVERSLIEPMGKLEVPGRPILYGTSGEFLKHFGLKDLKALPHIEVK